MAGPVVLITGASSGIGRATSERYARRGASLVLCSRSAEALDVVAARCRQLGSAVEVTVADVTDAGQVDAAIAAAEHHFGRLDVVVSCAAVMSYGTVVRTPAEVFDRVVAVNLLGAAAVARAALGVFRRQEHGTLVVVGSLLGRVAIPLAAPYVTSKFALRGLTRVLRQENRDLPGVRVVSVAPGAIRTPIYRQAATYVGRAAAAPPPTIGPDRVAGQILRAVARGSRERNADALGGALNRLMTAAYVMVPALFDRLVGPMMRLLSVRGRHTGATEGNVFTANPELER